MQVFSAFVLSFFSSFVILYINNLLLIFQGGAVPWPSREILLVASTMKLKLRNLPGRGKKHLK
jgi:hypothetical protein